jgi:hypothetical protein
MMDLQAILLQSFLAKNKNAELLIHAFSGVKPERLAEGLSPRHCALSLVGEPIMYPEINVLIDELHRRHISTFLVTNAQFPDKIKTLKPITQVIFELRSILAFKCSEQQALKISFCMVAAVCQCGCSYKGKLESCRQTIIFRLLGAFSGNAKILPDAHHEHKVCIY